jgi:hypothetical protein
LARLLVFPGVIIWLLRLREASLDAAHEIGLADGGIGGGIGLVRGDDKGPLLLGGDLGPAVRGRHTEPLFLRVRGSGRGLLLQEVGLGLVDGSSGRGFLLQEVGLGLVDGSSGRGLLLQEVGLGAGVGSHHVVRGIGSGVSVAVRDGVVNLGAGSASRGKMQRTICGANTRCENRGSKPSV